MKIEKLPFWNSKDYKRVLISSGKKLSPFEFVKITENLSFLGQRWHLVTLGDIFFSKTSSLKITIIFEDLNFLTQRWRFWWKYLPLGLHMRYSRKVNKKIFKLIILLEGKREHIIYNNQPNWSSTDQALATLIHWGKFFGVTQNMF